MADILVVDDDAAVRKVVAAALRAGGHRVAEAAHGEQAAALQGREPSDLVVLDPPLLRRAGSPPPDHEVVADRDLVVDATRHEARLAGRPLTLTAREFELLHFLVAHPGEVWSRDDLLREVWGWEFGDPSTVTVHVRRLRGKVEADPTRPSRLVTVWGLGYRWDVAPASTPKPAGRPPRPVAASSSSWPSLPSISSTTRAAIARLAR